MSLYIKKTPQLIYISYAIGTHKNFIKFRTELLSLENDERDVAVDFSESSKIFSTEIGVLARFLSFLKKGSLRYLRVITNPTVKSAIDCTGIGKLENLILYNSQPEFFEQMKKGKGGEELKYAKD